MIRKHQNDGSIDSSEEVIESWMRMVLETGGTERFDDLHIDQISPNRKHRETWVMGSMEAINVARKVWSRTAPDKVLALMCSLACESNECPPDSTEELAAQMDWSPPSLYLFEPGSEPWSKSSGVGVQQLKELLPSCTCLLLEFRAVDQIEPRRTFVCIP